MELLSASIFFLVALSSCHGQAPVDRSDRECVEFTHSYCNKFNYSTAIFPNPRGHETPEKAAAEFGDFTALLNNNGCHPKLGTLLCFIYFPVCNKGNFNPENSLVEGFYPCHELCQEVHNSSCTEFITSTAGSWAPHLQCDFTDEETRRSYYKPANSLPDPTNCINGEAPKTGGGPVNECATGANNCHVNAVCSDTAAGFNCTCKNGFTGNGRDCSDVDECSAGTHDCSVNAECTNIEGGYTCTCNAGYTGDGKNCIQVSLCTEGVCEICNYRDNANSKTFKRNCYCYAARVSIVSSSEEDCNHVYLVTVKEQFDLKTPYNTTHTTSAPALASDEQITVIANPSHCDRKCPMLTNDEEYLIAGSYSRDADGTVAWHLEGSENRALASVWKGKYSNKMSKWIEDGNSERQSGLLCQQQCEK